MTVMKETRKHGVILVHGNILKINLLNILRYSHITIMRDSFAVSAALLRESADVAPAASVLAP